MNTKLIALALSIALAGCTGLPGTGPGAKSILEGGTVVDRKESFDYQVLKVDIGVVDTLNRSQPLGFVGSIDELPGGAASGNIGVGDTVAVTIYESATGGLFSTTDALGNGSKSITLPPQQVDSSGRISVPYAGRIKAAGRSTTDVQRSIEGGLKNLAIEPQAIVTVTQNASRFVTVSGEVGQGGRFPLNPRGDRVLDAVGLAGGPKNAAHQIYVRLSRGKKSAVIRMSELVSKPQENILLAPGDQLFLYREPKRITFLGATAKNSSVEMETEDVTLSDALGQASGLLDDRSDPKGLFVFRFEDAKVMRQLGLDAPDSGVAPVVYNIDFSNAQGVFLTQAFRVRDKDIVYVSNAPTTDLEKFLKLVGGVTGVAAGARAVVRP